MRALLALVALVVTMAMVLPLGAVSASAAGNGPGTTSAKPAPTTTTLPKSGKATAGPRKNVVTFGTQTANAAKPDGRASFQYGATPGGDISDHVAVRNYSALPLTLSLQGTDLGNSASGAITGTPVDQPSKDLGSWISVPAADRTVHLAARQTLIVPFTVHVPKNATPGDHFGAVTATLQGTAVSKTGQHVKLLQTTGTRVFLRVSGPLRPHLSITHMHVHYKGKLSPASKGEAEVTYTVNNDGNVGLGGQQSLYVKGMFGTKSSVAKAPQLQLLLPGDSVKQTVTVKGVIPEVRETAHISIVALYITGTQNPPSGPFQASSHFSAIQWIEVAILVIILLALATLVYRWWRRRRIHKGKTKVSPEDPASPGAASPQSADTDPANDVQPAGDSEPVSAKLPPS